MFKKIIIDKYRGIKRLELNDISRINLFVGKNNTGKTSILEAISILSLNEILRNGDGGFTTESLRAIYGWIYKLPFDRNYDDFIRHYSQGRNKIDLNREVFSSILYNRNFEVFNGFTLKGSLYNDFGLSKDFMSEEVSFFIAAEFEKIYQSFNKETGENQDIKGKSSVRSASELLKENIKLIDTKEIFHFAVSSGRSGNGSPHPLGYDFSQYKSISDRISNTLNMQYIKTNDNNKHSNSLLHDKIVFDTIKLERLTNALKIIEPGVEMFAFQANEFGERSARIKLKNISKPIPMTTMGDGMNRILTIILALVNCQNGYLIIDEFENGLHYSVQKELWEIIFQLAESFNIQVFASTHSNDTINSFAEVLNSRSTYLDTGKAYRLQRESDDIIAINYSQKELYTSTKFDVEIR